MTVLVAFTVRPHRTKGPQRDPWDFYHGLLQGRLNLVYRHCILLQKEPLLRPEPMIDIRLTAASSSRSDVL